MESVAVPVVDSLLAERLSVEEKLRIVGGRISDNIDELTVVEIPVGEEVYHRLVRPDGLIEIVCVLGEAGGVGHSEEAVLAAVGCGFAYVVDARPDELTGAEFPVTILYPSLFGRLSPDNAAVAE